MPGMTTSSRTRSTPPAAASTAPPRPRTPRRPRSRAARAPRAAAARSAGGRRRRGSPADQRLDLPWQRAHVDRLLQVAVEARGEQPRAVVLHRVGGQRGDRDRRRDARRRAARASASTPVIPGRLMSIRTTSGRCRARERDPRLGVARLERRKPAWPSTSRTSLRLRSLSSTIRTSRLIATPHRDREAERAARPDRALDPDPPAVQLDEALGQRQARAPCPRPTRAGRRAGRPRRSAPGPPRDPDPGVAHGDDASSPTTPRARPPTRPTGVNLTALVSRFTTTCLSLISSAHTTPTSGATSSDTVSRCRAARSRTSASPCSSSSGSDSATARAPSAPPRPWTGRGSR